MATIMTRIGRAASRLSDHIRSLAEPVDPRTVKFMIIGIQKGGTTWLSTTLNQIPGLQKSRPKETRFFNANWKPDYALLPTKRLRSLYLGQHWPNVAADQTLFEASPGYLASGLAAERVARCFPKVKCVVLLRDPVSRAFSNYNMWVRNRGLKDTFRQVYRPQLRIAREAAETAMDEEEFFTAVSGTSMQRVISHGLYYYHLRMWFAKFPRNQFFIMTTKQLNDQDVYARLLDFIGVDRQHISHVPFELEPKDRHQGSTIAPEDAAELEAFYEPYTARLFKMLKVSELDW